MNISNMGHSFAKVKGADAAPANALDALGNQLMLDPEILKMLESGEGAENQDFLSLLKGMTDEQKEALMASQQKTGEVKNLLGQAQNTSLESALKTPEKSDLSTLLNTKSSDGSKLPLSKNGEAVEVIASDVKDMATKKENKILDFLSNKKKAISSKINSQSNKAMLNSSDNLIELNNKFAGQKMATKTNQYQNANKSMFANKMAQANPVQATQVKEVSLQDVMMGQTDSGSEQLDSGQSNQKMEMGSKLNTQAPQKTFNLSQLNNTANTEQVITKIQDYIMQAKTANEPRVEMSFTHTDLGQVDLVVQKDMHNNINLMIGANSKEAVEFFTQNQADLLGTLAKSGVQIGEFKLESSSSSQQSLSQDSSQSKQGTSQGEKQHNSQSGQRDEESKKREELWNIFKDKEAA